MRGDIKKLVIKRAVVRVVALKEHYGYEILNELRLMGIQTGSNYLYEILSEMEEGGLIKGRWGSNPSGKPSRHYYGLAERGERELDTMVREAIDLVNERILLKRVKDSPRMLDEVFSGLGVPSPRGRLVEVLPDSNPAVSYWLHLHILNANVKNAAIYVVKPPSTQFPDSPSGITILDGRRNDLPFKDGFADFLLIAGLPVDSTVEKTVDECARVLNNGGHFVLKHPNSLTEDRAPKQMAGYEHFAKLIYEVYEGDKLVNLRQVMGTLSKRFQRVKDCVFGGSTWIHAQSKKS